MLKSLVHKLGRGYIRKLCRDEYRNQTFRWVNERPVEYRFVFDAVAQFCPRTVLDIGTGKTAIPSVLRTCGCLVTAIDNVRDYWPKGMINRHWHVLDDDVCKSRLSEQFDMVTCISVLEHIVNFDAAMRSMFALTKPGGHVVLTCPYNESKYVENAYRLPDAMYGSDSPYVCQVYSRDQVNAWVNENGAEIVDQEFWQFFTGEFWTCGELVRPPRPKTGTELHQHTCILFRKK